jgi:hypothetical protein
VRRKEKKKKRNAEKEAHRLGRGTWGPGRYYSSLPGKAQRIRS